MGKKTHPLTLVVLLSLGSTAMAYSTENLQSSGPRLGAALQAPVLKAPSLVLPPIAMAPEQPSEPPAATQVDSDGVAMIFPADPQGSSWALGAGDPNRQAPYFDLNGDEATQVTEGGITYWTTTGHKVNYASGAPSGKTVRLNIQAAGDTQQYSWSDGGLEYGYLGSPKDLKNFEATAYVRVRGDNGTKKSMNWKMRGGKHSSSDAALSSCVEMGVPHGDDQPEAGRELDHPTYDKIPLNPQFSFQLEEGKWVAVKVVSWVVPGGTQNRMYLDTEPFDAHGKPRNGFRLFTEWMDKDGENTGNYTQAATWAGWRTTFRVDGWKNLDFAHLSAREIVPPQS